MDKKRADELRAQFADDRPTDELIQLALVEMDIDFLDRTRASTTLHFRGTREVFEACQKLCESSNAKERALGVDILGQLGVPDRPFLDETIAMLIPLMENEKDLEVLYSIGVAFGHLDDLRPIDTLVKFKNHMDFGVRYGVVSGLTGLEDDRAIKTLIELSQDSDEVIRDWATFGLGSQIDANTPEIREALFRNIDDPDEVVRWEAFAGLAARRVREVIPRILDEMDSSHTILSHVLSEICEMLTELKDEISDPRLPQILEAWDCENYT